MLMVRRMKHRQSPNLNADMFISLDLSCMMIRELRAGDHKRIPQLPSEKQEEFCFWGCSLRIFLHITMFVVNWRSSWHVWKHS
jgi:hypothetical protein